MERILVSMVIAFGIACSAIGGEVRSVYQTVLRDGRQIEVREMIEIERVADATNGMVALQNGAKVGIIPINRGSVRYEMFQRTNAVEGVKLWDMTTSFVGEDVIGARCHVLDVIDKGRSVAILYSRHVGVYVDVVDVATSAQKVSHFVSTTISPDAVSEGRLFFFDDDLYAFFRTASSGRVLFLIGAEGTCTQMEVRPRADARRAIP